MARDRNNRKLRQRTTASGSRPRRAYNKRHKTGLWDSIKSANDRAHQRSNERSWKRKGLTSVKAAITSDTIDDYQLSTAKLILRTLIGLVLLFPCFISTIALFDIGNTSGQHQNFWNILFNSQPFIFFSIGVFLMLGWFYSGLARSFFLYIYVLGHELTHAFFIYLCGGKVSEFKVTKDGGFVVTNKSNVLISLSPYFVPFWSLLLLGISMIVGLFWDSLYHDLVLFLLIGASWTFHLAWTLWMIPRDQPDLKENGSFFSLTIIYLANVLLLAFMLCLVTNELNLKDYAYQWLNLCAENGSALIGWVKSFF